MLLPSQVHPQTQLIPVSSIVGPHSSSVDLSLTSSNCQHSKLIMLPPPFSIVVSPRQIIITRNNLLAWEQKEKNNVKM
jgi:hypothetical protein